MALTQKQRLFVEEYIIDFNATQAAIKAGYSKKTAYSIGQRLLKNVEIQKALQKAMKKRSERTQIDQDYVIMKLKEIADKPASDELYSDLKYSSKLRALELLGRHTGAFEPKQDAEQGVTIVIDV